MSRRIEKKHRQISLAYKAIKCFYKSTNIRRKMRRYLKKYRHKLQRAIDKAIINQELE